MGGKIANKKRVDDIGLDYPQKQRDSERFSEPEVKPEAFPPNSPVLATAKQSLEASRQAVEKLLDSIPRDDHYSLGVLGPILSSLRDAERDIERI